MSPSKPDELLVRTTRTFNKQAPAERIRLIDAVRQLPATPAVVDFLRCVAGQDADVDVRFHARRALDTMGELGAAVEDIQQEGRKELLARLREEQLPIRMGKPTWALSPASVTRSKPLVSRT